MIPRRREAFIMHGRRRAQAAGSIAHVAHLSPLHVQRHVLQHAACSAAILIPSHAACVCHARHAAGFYAAVRQFVLIICVAAPLFSFTSWVEERLVLAWRAALTRFLARAYFSHM